MKHKTIARSLTVAGKTANYLGLNKEEEEMLVELQMRYFRRYHRNKMINKETL